MILFILLSRFLYKVLLAILQVSVTNLIYNSVPRIVMKCSGNIFIKSNIKDKHNVSVMIYDDPHFTTPSYHITSLIFIYVNSFSFRRLPAIVQIHPALIYVDIFIFVCTYECERVCFVFDNKRDINRRKWNWSSEQRVYLVIAYR